MIKKIIAGTLLSAMTLFALPNNEVELLLVSKAIEKKSTVLANMHLNQDKVENFGKLYDEYQEKLLKHRISEIKLIKEYAKDYQNMSDKNANRILDDWTDVETSKVVLKKEYIKKFKKILPSSAVIRYFQIENRIQLAQTVNIKKMIPFAIPEPIQLEIK